jgi:hypothetical protein
MNKREIEFIKETGLVDYLEDGVIKVPEHCTSIKIDVGLAGDAPHSALWLLEDPNVFVIGIEPLEWHCQHLYELGSANNNTNMLHPRWPIVQLKNQAVLVNREIVCDIKDRFVLIKAAVNNIDSYEKQKFYLNKSPETGSSSLKKAQADKRPYLIDKIIDVNVCSLEKILSFLPKDRFDYIQHIKTDTEAMDFEVIKSIGDQVKKVIYINSEIVHLNFEEKSKFLGHMFDKGFRLLSHNTAEFIFVNKRFEDLIEKQKIPFLATGI